MRIRRRWWVRSQPVLTGLRRPAKQIESAREQPCQAGRWASSARSRTRMVATAIIMAILGVACEASAQDETECGSLAHPWGPKDYRKLTYFEKNLVENAHFTPSVELLQSGVSSAQVGGDIDYTLRAVPNHARALLSMSKLTVKEKKLRPAGASYEIGCYFERAIRFQPDDPDVRMVYGYHLLRHGDKQGAIRELEKARDIGGGGANLHYNLGLGYFEAGEPDKALEEARRAYALGFPLPGLRDKLKRAGKWVD